MATRFVTAIARALRHPTPISEAQIDRRIATCEACPRFDPRLRQCGACLCFVDLKATIATERCPEKYW